MKKENILEGKLNLIEWCQTLQRVPDDIWFQALKRFMGNCGCDFTFYRLGCVYNKG